MTAKPAAHPVTFRRKKLVLLSTAALMAAVVVFATGPRAPRRANATAAGTPGRTVRGAFHIHTTRSDGALGKSEVAAAAARAGLQFAVFADHGDGIRPADPPEYLNGVLCVDGVEVSTNGGHYIGIGMAPAPYPLGGEAAAVAEDVARLGGFGVVAHPVSGRAELSWSAWDVPFDGIEWLNADSEWRDESRLRLARGVLDYLWRPGGALASLLDRPAESLRRWDLSATSRRVVGLAGHDAHGGFGAEAGGERGRRLHIPSYEASFRTFSIYVTVPRPLTGDAGTDAAMLVAALKGGAVFTAIDAIASPAALEFQARLGGATASTGGQLPMADGVAGFSVRAAAPEGAATVLRRDGVEVARASGGVLDHDDSRPGAYRAEIEVPGAPGSPPVPWLVSNPIYRRASTSASAAASSAPPAVVLPLPQGEWRVESDSGSSGTLTTTPPAVSIAYELKGEPKASQFVALVTDMQTVPTEAATIVFHARAGQPMRVSAQLRYANDGDERWGRSVYVDQSDREIRLPIRDLRHQSPPGGDGAGLSERPQPSVTRATSLLFVIDLTNALPASRGTLMLRDVGLAR